MALAAFSKNLRTLKESEKYISLFTELGEKLQSLI